MKCLPWPLAMLGFLALIAGCTKQLPSPDLNFETTQKVVLTFRSGEEVEGKVRPHGAGGCAMLVYLGQVLRQPAVL